MRYLERRVERPICLARDVFHLLRRLRSRSRMTLAALGERPQHIRQMSRRSSSVSQGKSSKSPLRKPG